MYTQAAAGDDDDDAHDPEVCFEAAPFDPAALDVLIGGVCLRIWRASFTLTMRR